ncbi:MAG: CDP-diacylglycerol--glycerol-3-phosphate 3-phosphatidyltransferase [Coriobacteriales bacterium]|jgi:CDP-diacylglycerol--glycerol-3-phosphate 3-phosphatidyltransferase|nr:CDP-diacylglycerol--glycerol-3-phosphate 3-phosphatidyltransferase [Coriobacteriales bacterium]
MAERGTNRGMLTPANIVTTMRIVLIPVFVFFILAPWPDWTLDPDLAQMIKPWVAAAVFAALAATDAVDGYLARSRAEVTNLGKFLDPLADKILVTAALLALIELGTLPAWVALVIVAREFLVSGLRMVAATEGKVIAASRLGKIKTVTQIAAIIAFIIKDSVVWSFFDGYHGDLWLGFNILAWIVMSAALILTLLSLMDYFIKSADVLGFSAQGTPKDRDA